MLYNTFRRQHHTNSRGTFAKLYHRRQEMIRRYPDQEATMGEARLVGETGPDEAGKRLSPTTIKVCHLMPFIALRCIVRDDSDVYRF
jgi:hypothetical protein